MPSVVAWLDHSAEQQRRVRDMLMLMSSHDTVDDLGIGTIRDAISDLLFPGSSVIQTRARYFLFVPWIYQHFESRRVDLLAKGRDAERQLIGQLLLNDDPDELRGVIGRQAGVGLKTLPSAIYWSGLQRFGIFRSPKLALGQYARAVARGTRPPVFDDEFAERAQSFWCELPDPPPGMFDKQQAMSLRLRADDARWLRDRILTSERNGQPYLSTAWIREVARGGSAPDVAAPWDALPKTATSDIEELVEHARQFSLLVWGVNNLYNVMLVEARRAKPLASDGDEASVEDYHENLRRFDDEARARNLTAWTADIDSMWRTLAGRPVENRARSFVDEVAALVARVGPEAIVAGHAEMRALIVSREQAKKGSQARFGNERRLREYRGYAGTSRLAYRWGVVSDIVGDIAEGLASEDGN